jgi:hypothetical protein
VNSDFDVPTKAWALRRAAQVLLAGARVRTRGARYIPRSPAHITAEWLTAVLCTTSPATRVTSVIARDRSAGTTTRAALELTYSEPAELPTHVFVKCTSALSQRLMLGLGGLIYGEAGFYAHVRPRLEIEAPAGYFEAVDPRSWRSIVLIEDVTRTRGASFWRPSTTITRPQIEDLLVGAATWHGALWNSPQLAEWRWLKTPADQMRVIDSLLGLADRTGAGIKRAGEVVPAAVRRRRRDLLEAMRRSMQLASQGPRTYLHGDLHIANTYLADRMGVVDWQVGLQGSWAHDFAYLLSTALSVEDRRAWERNLLDFYLERLTAAGGDRVARDEAWRAYRQATFYPLFAWLYTLGRSRLQPSFQPREVSLTMIERTATAIDDLESFAAVRL